MIEISCIIVNYNNEKYLRTCLDSLINQTKKIDEIIIADDCSTDNSRQIIKEYKEIHENIVPIFNKRNLGVTQNRDLAIRQAKGKYITTVDSDDFFFSTKIEKEYNLIRKFPDSIVASNTVDINENGEQINIRNAGVFCRYNYKNRINHLICKSKDFVPRDMMMSKEIYIKAGGLDSDFKVYEDWEFKLRLCINTKRWMYSGSNGTAYRHTNKGLSSQKHLRLFYFHLKAIIKNLNIVSNKKLYLFSLIKFILIKIPSVVFSKNIN